MNQDDSIKSCNLDGSNVNTLVEDSVQHYIVTYDQIYFATKQIECMDLNGENRRTIVSQEGNYDELSLCDNYLLYTDYTSDQSQICVVNIDTVNYYALLNNTQQGRRYGEYLYYSVGTVENSTYPLRIYQISTSEVEQISLGSYPNVQEEVMF